MSTLFTDFFTKINQISPQEHVFTEKLEPIALKHKTLYFRGKMPKNMSKDGNYEAFKTVAIVGSRHNTKYGEEIAYHLAYELAKHNVVIISGLAFGIDSIAHKGCLAAKGQTVAVLGTPINRIYPKEHTSLAREIIDKGGAIISEYAPDEKVFPKVSFLERNRIISGLSDIVVVVEAAEKSGSLNTATHAINQGKTVFAVPGNITNPYSQGCNKLIKQGALPYTDPKDLLELLFPEEFLKKRRHIAQHKLFGDNDLETAIIQALATGLRSGEDIMASTHLPPELFNETITVLEIKGAIRSLGANNWCLV